MPQQATDSEGVFSTPPGSRAPRLVRYALLDDVRGLASVAVCIQHFIAVWAHYDRSLLGWPLDWIILRGYLGVAVFFVLSGFVIPFSLHNTTINATVVGKFALKRSIRLDFAYWVALFLSVGYEAYNHIYPIKLGVVLANMAYIHRLAGIHSQLNISWTLCYEVQFYLFYILLFWIFQRLSRRIPSTLVRLMLFLPPLVLSWLIAWGRVPTPLQYLFIDRWYLFFIGTVTWWYISGTVSAPWLACCIIPVIPVWSPTAVAALATAAVFLIAHRMGRLERGLGVPLFQYFGSRSYSLYLLHVLIGKNLLVYLFDRGWVPHHALGAIVVFLSVFAVTMLATELLYRLVELPSHRLSRRISWSSSGRTEPALPASGLAPCQPGLEN